MKSSRRWLKRTCVDLLLLLLLLLCFLLLFNKIVLTLTSYTHPKNSSCSSHRELFHTTQLHFLFVLKIPINKSKHHAKLHDQNQRNTYNTCHRIKIKSKKKKKEYNLNSTQVYKTIHHIPKICLAENLL